MKFEDEVVDTFDESGNHTGTAWLWKDVHKNGIWHKTSASFIFKDHTKKELLLQRRSKHATHDPNCWSHSGGGHLPAGFSSLDGIKKELHEELFFEHSLPILDYTEVGVCKLHDLPDNYEFLTLYEIIYPGPFYLNPTEVRTLEWHPFETLKKDLQSSSNLYTKCFKLLIDFYYENSDKKSR